MAIPKRIVQTRMETCWAACMECWTREAYYYSYIGYQEALANTYGKQPTGGLDSNGGKINDFCNEFWLARLIIPGGQLTKDRVEKWLEIPGYFMLVSQTGEGTSHAVLVYEHDDGIIKGMNPDPGAPYPFRIGLTNLPTVLAFHLDPKKLPRA